MPLRKGTRGDALSTSISAGAVYAERSNPTTTAIHAGKPAVLGPAIPRAFGRQIGMLEEFATRFDVATP